MKTLKCNICDYEAQGEMFEALMEALNLIMLKSTRSFMKQQSNRSEAEQKVEMKKWEIENRARFDVA